MKLFLCGGGSGKQILNALYKFSNILNKKKANTIYTISNGKRKIW